MALAVAFAGAFWNAYLTERAQTAATQSDARGLARVYGLYLAQQADRFRYSLVRGRRPELVTSPLSAENLKVLATALPRKSWEAVAKAEYSITRTLGSPDPDSADRLLCRLLDAQGAIYRAREALGQELRESATFPISPQEPPPNNCPPSPTLDLFSPTTP